MPAPQGITALSLPGDLASCHEILKAFVQTRNERDRRVAGEQESSGDDSSIHHASCMTQGREPPMPG